MSAVTRWLAVPGGGGIEIAVPGEGGRWQVQSLLGGEDVRCLAADPVEPGTLYAGTQGHGVWRSEDRGSSWTPLGLSGTVVKSLAVSPLTGTLYAGTRPADVFISEDGGANWRPSSGFKDIRGRWLWFSPAEPPWKAYVQGLTASPTDPGVVLAGVEFGAVVRSTDGGDSWSSHLSGSLRDCHCLTFHASDGDWVYEAGGTGGGVAYSRDGGETWHKRKDGLDRHYGWACAADPAKPEVWYASLAPGPGKAHGGGRAEAFVYRAVGGAPWQKLPVGSSGPLASMPYALLTERGSPGHLHAGMANGQVWHSADYGDSWTKLPFTFSAIRHGLLNLAI